MTNITTLSQGLVFNVFITLLSAILPFGLGVLFTFLCSKDRTSSRIFGALSVVFESLCPIVLLLIMFFCVFKNTRSVTPAVIIAMTLSFICYMPARYVSAWGVGKNIAVNSLGLISSLFKWSFCVSWVACKDMLGVANIIRNKTYDSSILWYVLIVSFVILLILETGKYLARTFIPNAKN
ncbi:MAG: hypothetical protein J5590_06300 [Clostridia bacterium]|nr:hypothetical protein [Clostridia bacterium]